MLDKIVIGVAVGVGVLCVLGIIPIPQYTNFMGWAIVGAIKGIVLWTVMASFISVLWGSR